MKYTTVLFDLDGTLTESGIGIRKCFDYALNTLFPGKVWDEELFSGIVGPPLIDSMINTFKLSETDADKAIALYRERYDAKGKYENRLYDGVESMLKALRQNGITLALCTSKPKHFAKDILEHFGIDSYFSFIGGATPTKERNSKISVMRYVLENTAEKDTSKILMVGDKFHDLEAAEQLKLDCIGVLYGYGTKEELLNYPHVFLAQKPADISDYILK